MTKGAAADIILADWGTSSLRLWAVDREAKVLDERRSSQGMGTMSRDGYAPELQRHLSAMGVAPDTPVLICGMAGAAQGWQEAAYLDLPADFALLANNITIIRGETRDIRIVPGIAQRDRDDPDVMRGEETILHGLIHRGLRDGIVCLPGTHAKWARIENGVLVRFRTMMTGEMFALLGHHSILRHSFTSNGFSAGDFIDGVREAYATPARTLTSLFGLRAGPLLFGRDSPHAASRLSGLMIGAEIASCLDKADHGLHLAATGEMARRYCEALDALAISFDMVDAEHAVRTGLFELATGLWPERIAGGTSR